MSEADGVSAAKEAEITLLCREIIRTSGGSTSVTFGQLARDDQVENTFEALFGTLKAAKKRGVVDFQGELLLVGKHDDTIISLTARGEKLGGATAVADAEDAAAAAVDTSAATAEDTAQDIAAAESTTPAPAVEAAVAEAAAADAAPAETEQVAEEVAADEGSVGEETGGGAALEPATEAGTHARAEALEAKEPAAPAAKAAEPAAEAVEAASPKAEAGYPAVAPATTPTKTPPASPPKAPVASESAKAAAGDNQPPAGQELAEGEGGRRWSSVKTSYIDHRTADPDRLESRRGQTASDASDVASGAVGSGAMTRDKDGKWQPVDVSTYINHRTKEVERLEGRKAVGSADADTILAAASSTVKKEGEKWKVDTSYIKHRTIDANTIKGDGAPASTSAETAPTVASSTVRKEGDGKWKVDTSYIGYRTKDTGNLNRKEEAKEDNSYADPAVTKYTYEQVKGAANRPADVDPARKEQYLAEEEFQAIFGTSMADFTKLPKWKQQNLKKAKDVF